LDDAAMDWPEIDAVAVGHRPGLIGSLIVGVSAAKALAWALDKPLIGVDHVQAHLYAPSLTPPNPKATHESAHSPSNIAHPMSEPPYPALGLVVSGGHTSLYQLTGPGALHRLGGTIDDAIGEAFDKAASIVEAGYPGGPAIEQLAKQGDPRAYQLPKSLLDKDSLDFSFSGLKTALLYTVRGRPQGRGKNATFQHSARDLTFTQRADLAASFQKAAVDAIGIKLKRALTHWPDPADPPRAIIAGGGVTANQALRAKLEEVAAAHDLPLYLPPMVFCVDNAAMIGGLAYHQFKAGQTAGWDLPAMAAGTTG
jgi:N6-L-threonylcarbamoyladenine synthase